jgi:prevent-host-death family protein
MSTAAKKPKKALASKKPATVKRPATTVGVRELRQNASQILDLVKDGQIIEITQHGVPVARIAPIARSIYEEHIESGLIKPALNPNWQPTRHPIKIAGSKSSTDILLELRAAERY